MKPEIWLPIFLAVIAAAPGILALVFYQKLQRAKMAADTDNVNVMSASEIADTAREMLAPLRAELKVTRDEVAALRKDNIALSDRVQALENENSDLKDWAERLVHQVRSMGQEPVKPRLRGESK